MVENKAPAALTGQRKKFQGRTGTVGRSEGGRRQTQKLNEPGSHSHGQGENNRLACPVAREKIPIVQTSQGVESLGTENRSPKLCPGEVNPRGKQVTVDLSDQSYKRR